MKFPIVNEIASSRDMIDVFGGYNHNIRIQENEFFDMKNMTSDHYPVLAPRGKRGVYASPVSDVGITGMISKDALLYIDGSKVYYNGFTDGPLDMELSDAPKQLISMGSYVIIMPDKKYINTKNLEDRGNIEVKKTVPDADGSVIVKYSLCDMEGKAYDATSSPEAPGDDIVDGTYWIDTSTSPNTLKQWSESSAMWTSIPTTYIKISAPGIGADFNVYDGVKITGIAAEGPVELNNNVSVIWAKDEDYIVLIGFINGTLTQQCTPEASLVISRDMPDMDFVIESGNRLWGCKYGLNTERKIVNEIYASKLGDFKNWNCFMGVSTDSYAASCGTDGQWTGAVTHLGYPLFFKENCLHKVYGQIPANFQIQTLSCRGVQKGCERSLAIVNETLYYKSRSGVCAYDGALPVEVSSALGNEVYTDAVGGAHGNKYYISMKGTDDKYNLFVFDTQKGLWHREDNTQAKAFCSCRGEMYFIDAADGRIKTVISSENSLEGNIEWEAVTGVFGLSSPDKKRLSKLNIRMQLALGTKVFVFAQYDSSSSWELITTLIGTSLKSFSIPVKPRRCDHFRLKICGIGDAKIYSISKTMLGGSDK